MKNDEICEHIKKINELKLPKELVCEERIKIGSAWVRFAHMSDLWCNTMMRPVRQ